MLLDAVSALFAGAIELEDSVLISRRKAPRGIRLRLETFFVSSLSADTV
jgi:hypothetical protein